MVTGVGLFFYENHPIIILNHVELSQKGHAKKWIFGEIMGGDGSRNIVEDNVTNGYCFDCCQVDTVNP